MRKSYIAGICLTAAALVAVPALSGQAEEQVTVNFDGSTVTTNDSDRVKISQADGESDIDSGEGTESDSEDRQKAEKGKNLVSESAGL